MCRPRTCITINISLVLSPLFLESRIDSGIVAQNYADIPALARCDWSHHWSTVPSKTSDI